MVSADCTFSWRGKTATELGKEISVFAEANGLLPEDEKTAQLLDSHDQLASLREEFVFPLSANGAQPVYFVGNSLGLQPKRLARMLQEELEVWSKLAVEGHFSHPYGRPWLTADDPCAQMLCSIVGAASLGEVAVMGSLTANLHLLLCAFYRPTADRFKILIEQGAFPSDHYAVESQIKLHGLDPKEALVVFAPRKNERLLDHKDMAELIRMHGQSTAIILLPGIQYLTGQLFPIQAITKLGHEMGCLVGWDLAHAVGNVPLQLHDWNVDFAAWCHYKYMNSGPGAIAGLFVHKAHATNANLSVLRGWWSHNVETRFEMNNQLEASPGAPGFRVSNPDILSLTACNASLQIFSLATMEDIRSKTALLHSYLKLLLQPLAIGKDPAISLITPDELEQCGAQLSIQINRASLHEVLAKLGEAGLMLDERKPDILRAAPTGLYNTFQEVWRAAQIMKKIFG